MEILFVTNFGESLGLISRLVTEGHTCKVYGQGGYGLYGKGIFEWVKHPYEAIKSCKYIIADPGVDAKIYDWARTFNKPIVGASPLTDLMNLDAAREYDMAKRLGIGTPSTEVINDIGNMFDKVLDWNSNRTLIRYDRETITCDHKQWFAWALYKLPLGKTILLQTPSYGEEVNVFGWFDGVRWMKPFLLKTNNERRYKACTMLALRDRDWVNKLLEPWGEFLKAVDYKGPFNVKANISKKGVELISTHAGIETPSVYAFAEGIKEPIGDFLYRLAFSSMDKTDITTDYMSAIAVSSAMKNPGGVPIVGIDEGNLKHIFLGSVDKTETDTVISGSSFPVYTATAHGRDMSESLGRAYFTIERVRIPEPNYMTHLASAYTPWFNKIRVAGYI